MSVSFCTIASGSGGNSVFISGKNQSILIDAGLSGKVIERGLNGIGISAKDISAVFLTHEHNDHTRGAGILSRRYDIPIYTTAGTWKRMSSDRISAKNQHTVKADKPIELGKMRILPFSIPHDAAEPVGYSIMIEGRKISVATDLGYITPNVAEYIYGSDIILIESNHDIEMLRNCRYPAYLKRRILGEGGHLSNIAAGLFIKEIFSPKTKHIFLGHLSQENNRPMLAYDTVREILTSSKINVGKDCCIYLASRKFASPLFTLNSDKSEINSK
ncbi:MAG: MBL fold metallo-hydrolase [Defluviitaleaceae bacterium]|nr:MBL fold metallo-hydrolase [Defluviitaleaceae bacterium]